MFRKLVSLLAAYFSLALSADPGVSQVAQSLTQELPSGYAVRSGKMRLLSISDCDQFIPVFGNCFGNNPAAPYVTAMVPQIPGEYIDPKYATSLYYPEEPAGLSFSYRLNANEAVVLMGQTPPEGAYFGTQTYLFTREGVAKPPLWFPLLAGTEKTNLFYAQSPNPARFLSFASLNEAMNNTKFARQLGTASSFNQRFYQIISADQATANVVKQGLIRSGASERAIFLEAIPSSIRMGIGSSADDFATMFRYAIPRSETSGETWRRELPMTLLRVTGPASTMAGVVRFGAQPEPLLGGNDESGLSSALQDLAGELKEAFGLSIFTEAKEFFPPSIIGLTGRKCIPATMNCLGDTLDTDTYRASDAMVLDGNDVYIVAGVDHTETGNATYLSLAVNDQANFKGVASESQTGAAAGFVSGKLKGSAAAFLTQTGGSMSSALSASKSKLYMRLFARNCSGLPMCTVVSATDVALDRKITFIQRAYLRPGSTMGAAPEKLLSPRGILWKR